MVKSVLLFIFRVIGDILLALRPVMVSISLRPSTYTFCSEHADELGSGCYLLFCFGMSIHYL